MPIDFPNSPTLNQTYTYNNKIWVWNGTSWTNALSSATAVPANAGGTGLSSFAVGDILYASSATALSSLPAGTSGYVLATNGASTAPSWQNHMPTGTILMYITSSAPTGWVNCDGTALDRTTYANLFSSIVPSRGTVTLTIASPCVVTLSSHGFISGDSIYLTTTGALPTGLTANTLYYVIFVDANTFRLASSYANAIAGTALNTSGTQSGVHTLYHCPYGLGNGSTTFNAPDFRGRIPVGKGSGAGLTARPLGYSFGAETVALATTELPSHNHTLTDSGHTHTGTSGNQSANHVHTPQTDGVAIGQGQYGFSAVGGGYQPILIISYSDTGSYVAYGGTSADHTHSFTTGSGNANITIGNSGSGTAHQNMHPSLCVNYIIKT
jgi:microcystin-dependent protein